MLIKRKLPSLDMAATSVQLRGKMNRSLCHVLYCIYCFFHYIRQNNDHKVHHMSRYPSQASVDMPRSGDERSGLLLLRVSHLIELHRSRAMAPNDGQIHESDQCVECAQDRDNNIVVLSSYCSA
ncbi:hypothetical protein U9M48_002963 [Paspalum notatum var. saurae]|uniref:Uncharacterized protein n=1 Tax=Paspalum notatum var. saurae TaxID=547442 RepID=A0AAQ3PKD4_PASNO